jgi:hypothetical protein
MMPHRRPASGSARESITMLDDLEPVDLPGRRATTVGADPGTVVLTCANCGALMDERKCKLICRCGYFLSCSDYY